jgi:hypothetical protein
MASSDLLSNICDQLDARLRELRPLVDEYESLLDAAAALELAGEEDRAAATEPPVPVAVAVSAKPARRRGRPPGKRSAGRPAAEPAPAPEPAPEPAVDVKAEAESRSRPRTAKQPSTRRPDAGAPKRAQRGAAAVAILAALEHGSHTVSELAVVTALSGAIINNNLRRLQQVGAITRTKREGDGKAAYALTAAAA